MIDRAYDQPLTFEEHAAMPLAGGLMQGYQCGQLWGAALAAGAQAYRVFGAGPRAEAAAIAASGRLAAAFRAQNKEINCLELTQGIMKNPETKQILKFVLKGGPVGCFSMAGNYAPRALREINAALADPPDAVSCLPVSCAALLARKMGLSDLQQVMAAGFAGGIGLCGGACGALGAVVWITSMRASRAGENIGLGSTRFSALIDQFVEIADYEFECEKIVGRKFENASDHAEYVRGGGCAKIIETLAQEG